MRSQQQQYGLAGTKKSVRGYVLPFVIFMLFAAVMGLWVATQHMAYTVRWNSALGANLLTIDGIKIYAPWKIFIWRNYASQIMVENSTRAGIVSFAVPMIACLLILLQRTKKPGAISDLHGSARWATLEEIRNMGLMNGMGVFIGGFLEKSKNMIHYLRHNGPEHILGFAPTRSGKGVGPILMTLLSWLHSMVVFDIKGENWALTSAFRKYILGQKVFRFDPADPSDNGAHYNPFIEIRLASPKAIPDIQNIATILVDPEGKGLNDYWSEAAFAFMSGALAHVVVTSQANGRRASLNDLALAMANEDGDISELFESMIETDHAAIIKQLYPEMPDHHGHSIHQFISSSGREMLNKSDNERSGVIGSTVSKLSLYRDPVVALNTADSDFTIDDLMTQEQAASLYLVVSPADQGRMTPLMRLIVSLIISRRTEKMDFADGRSVAGYKHKLLMLLDEFTALGRLQVIEKSIAFCAGYGITLMIIVQDLVQLNAVYGKDNALMGNCHIRFAYAPNTIETANYLSEMTGKTTVIQDKASISGGFGTKKSTSKSVQETARALLTPDECMRLPGLKKNSKGEATEPGDLLLFIAGQRPIYGKQLLYFKDKVFLDRAKMAAPEYSDSFYRVREHESSQKYEQNRKTAPVVPPQASVKFENFLEE